MRIVHVSQELKRKEMGSAIRSFFLKKSGGNISCIKRKVGAGHPQQTIRKIRGTAAAMKTLAPLTLLALVCFVSAGQFAIFVPYLNSFRGD